MAVGMLTVTPRTAQAASGNDWRLGFTLWEAGVPKDLSAAQISAALRTSSGVAIITATAQSPATPGATWPSGIVVVTFPYASTFGLLDGDYAIEIQATIAGAKTTWPMIPVAVSRSVMS